MKNHTFSPRRPLGRTGFMATILGIGDLADRSVPLEKCVATARRAIDAGLNVIDTAPGYEDGYSEQIVGQALKGRRERMFVIDKIDHLRDEVAPQIELSLGRLGMDHADAFIFHGLSNLDDWQHVCAPGGGFEQLARCVERGQCRFRGISSHNPEVLRLAICSGLCDVVLFAIGPYCHWQYVQEILPLARQMNVGTVCFKTFGSGKLLGDTTGYGQPLQVRPRGKFSSGGADGRGKPTLPHLAVKQCVEYTLTLDPDVALLGLSFANEQDAAYAAAREFRPLSQERMLEIRGQASLAVQGKGPCWWNPDGK